MTLARLRIPRVALLAAFTIVTFGAPTLATAASVSNETPAAVSARCTAEGTERTVDGVLQRCTRNAMGVLRWKSAPSSSTSAAKVLLMPNVGYTDYMSSAIALTALRNGSAIVSGKFEGSTTIGSFIVRENQPFWGNKPDYRDIIEDRYLARISPDFEWAAAERFGGSGPTLWGAIGPTIALSDGSTIVTGRWRGEIALGTKRMAASTPRDDTYGITSNTYFGRLMPDGSWAWADGVGGIGGSAIQSAVETADGSILLSGWFRDVAVTDYLKSENVARKHFFMVVSKDGTNKRSWLIPTTLTIPGAATNEGASLDFQIVSSLADGSALVVGSYCGTVTLGALSLPSFSKSAGQKGDCGSFVARIRADLSFEWVREVEQTQPVESKVRKNSSIFGATVAPDGDVLVFGSLRNGDWKFGKKVVKNSGQGEFVARIDPQGTWRWVQRFPVEQIGYNILYDVAATPDNGVVVIGNIYQRSVTLGKLRFDAGVGGDGFAAKLNAAGNWVWVAGTKTNTDKESDVGTFWEDVDVAADGTVMVAGTITGKVTFGKTVIPTKDWELTGFVARLSPDGAWK